MTIIEYILSRDKRIETKQMREFARLIQYTIAWLRFRVAYARQHERRRIRKRYKRR